ncbi:hypothetical protein [Streptomyces sp. NBC_00986]|uniref:hypothetical protein n=1 Tax=Streptomyces sp. NBC_00986 TaxID=2903702 RepID=UPI00386B22FB|nr:hypothetical protein OG504_26995 [Streptomyces sp. NBC_00986]
MKSITTSAHIEPDTRSRVSIFPASSPRSGDHFVSLRIEGDFIEIALIARPGTSEALRNLAAAATEAAGALDAIAADSWEAGE